MPAAALALQRIDGAIRRTDRVVLATAGLFAALAALVPDQALSSLVFTLGSLGFIAPFFALSVLVAAGAKATGLDRQIAGVLGGRQSAAIVAAAAFGAFSPFCSCGVIPIIAGLLGAGVPLAPVMAFWISSPLMDPEMFILMAAILGLPLAIAKTLAAFLMGLAAGFATHALAGWAAVAEPLKVAPTGCGGCGGGAPAATPEIVWAFWRHDERRHAFRGEVLATGRFLLKWLTLAFVLESLMLAYVPAETVGWLGRDAWWVIPASVVVGVPTYLNGYAAIPMVDALLGMGMAPGAALAFMVAGGVTSIPAAMAVFALVKRRVFFLYLGFGLAGSLATGFIYQAL
jgi:hypothetical protein